MNVAIIPARGGSKRIPRKNIKKFCGAPLISYSIRAAQKSGVFDAIIVSTDDHEIAEVALEYGAEVPFMRPPELSDDYVSTLPVVNHAIEQLRRSGVTPTVVCCIYPTAPLLMSEDLIAAANLHLESDFAFVFAGCTYDYPIHRALRVTSEGVEMISPEFITSRSQDLELVYHDAGQFYFGTVDAWEQEQAIFGAKSQLFKIPRYRVIDIDCDEDWILAELLFRAQATKVG